MDFYKADGKLYPYYFGSFEVAQMPPFKKLFLLFAEYAGKKIEDVFDITVL
jgi:hypothetical protein